MSVHYRTFEEWWDEYTRVTPNTTQREYETARASWEACQLTWEPQAVYLVGGHGPSFDQLGAQP